jgi:hypothetical protein
MRSKLSCLAAAIIVVGAVSNARAADPKKGASKKKSGEMLNDNFDKQMQWENNVMGPDDKKAELAKIARAQAITKAGAEKAAAEKAAAERNPPREESRRAQATKNAAPVLLATPEDENAGKSTKNRDASPKFSTEEAAPPPPAVKPADDKFIDKLLKGEPGGKKRVAKAANDDELNQLLAKDKIAPAVKPARGKKVDSVDDLLRSAEKQPDMPAPKVKQPEWARADPAPTPAPVPVMLKPQPKKDDGVIRVVQGSAGSGSGTSRPQIAAASPPPSRRTARSDSFDRRDGDSFDAPTKRPSVKSASFSDPFADEGAAPRTRGGSTSANRAAVPTPAARAGAGSRREATGAGPGWRDPFGDPPSSSDRGKPARRGAEPKAPAGHPPGWKDPFSDAAPALTHRPVVAMREPRRNSSVLKPTGWGLLKKHARH